GGGEDDGLDVLRLVVGGQYQPRLARHGSAYPRACGQPPLPAARSTGAAHPRVPDRIALAGACRAYSAAVAPSDLPNAAIADALQELGDLYELDGAIVHRVVAYRTAARTVRETSTSVAKLARSGHASELPGIGKTLEEKILALLDTGSIPAL